MPEQSFTVNRNGVISTISVNRDIDAGVTTFQKDDGTSITVDRTATVIDSDRAGESRPLLSKVVGNAAAAYSLRDLNDKQGTTKVLEVRRDADNAEKTFKAKDVRTIEDWVNGKLETTLPADSSYGAAAAYSLRKVNPDYSENAVQIRRASDDVEVNVAFDSNGEVSTSSAISNVVESPDQGDTTSTTLGEFLTEVVDILDEPNFATDTGTLLGFGSTLTFDNDSVSDGSVSKDDCLEVELTSASNAYVRDYGANLYSGINNVKIRFEADFYAPSTNTSAVNLRLQNTFEEINGGGSQVFFPTTKGAWTSVSVEGYPNQNALQILVLDRTVGDVYYFANMKISIIGHDGTVVTWYDQSGNGYDATQLTTGDQPLIAEGGSLLADGIEFITGYLETTGYIVELSQNNASVFSVAKPNASTAGYILSELDTAGGSSNFILGDAEGGFSTNSVLWVNATTFGTKVSGESLMSFTYNGTNFQAYVNGAASGASGTATVNTEFGNKSIIGAGGTSGNVIFNGSISELITYKSDQSSNRFKIESNINNYYGIYTAAEDGFVETWYDQSGNGNHAVQDAVEGYQPKIVSAGSIITDDYSNPAIRFVDGSSNVLYSVKEDLDPALELSVFVVQKDEKTVNQTSAWFSMRNSNSVSNLTAFELGVFANTNFRIRNDPLADGANVDDTFSTSGNALNTTTLMTAIKKSNGDLDGLEDGASIVDISVTDNSDYGSGFGITIGKHNNTSQYANGVLNEVILYLSDQSANRPAIEANIANQYNLTLS